MTRSLLSGVVSGSELMAMEFPPQTARDLISAGDCWPTCMLAIGEDVATCECPCNGAYHGMLLDAIVHSYDEVPPPPDPGGTP